MFQRVKIHESRQDLLSEFQEILEDRIYELITILKDYEVIRVKRPLWMHEIKIEKTAINLLTFNESLLKILKPDYISIQ